jgi:hypothetical protein
MENLIKGLRKRFINLYRDLNKNIESDLRIMGYAIPIRSDQIPLVVFSYMKTI